MADLDLNINGDARRARAALNDVASGSARAARITDQLSRSFDHLENEANDAQRALDRVQDEINDTGPTAELNAELARLQGRLSDIADERRVTENLRAQFRRATASAATLDNQLEGVRRELDRLNDEYSQGGDPAVLRRIQEQQRELSRLQSIRRRIATEDEENQARLARMAEEARRAQARREDEERRRAEDEDNRSWLRRMRRRVSNLGDSAGNGLQAARVPPQALAIGAAIGANAAVPLLAALGGALTGLAGFGVAGAGIAGAIMGDPERFKAEWATATDTIKDEFLDATSVFTGPTIEAIRGIGPLVQSWDLDEVFADAAKYVPVIVRGVEGFATGIVRGVSAMVDKGEPAVEALAAGLAELGDAAGDAFEDIAEGAEGGAEALGDVLDATGQVIRGFGRIVGAAEDAYGYIHDHPVEASFVSMGAALPIVLFDQFHDTVETTAIALDEATIAANGGSTAADDLADSWEGAAAAMQDYEDTLHNIVDVQLGLLDANIGWEQSLDDLTESIKENGKNWDITTQKGRDNTAALEEAYRAAIEFRDAQVANGVQTGVANEQLSAQIAFLESVARAAGMTKAEFDRMAAALQHYIDMPQDKTITTKYVTFRYDYGVSKEGRIGSGEDPRTQTGKFYAAGGPVTETGWSMVGEHGPELRWLNKGDYIWDAQKTARALSGKMGPPAAASGAGGGLTMRIAGDNSWLAQAIASGVDSGQIQIYDGNGQPVRTRV